MCACVVQSRTNECQFCQGITLFAHAVRYCTYRRDNAPTPATKIDSVGAVEDKLAGMEEKIDRVLLGMEDKLDEILLLTVFALELVTFFSINYILVHSLLAASNFE